jgi:hypothetical protein
MRIVDTRIGALPEGFGIYMERVGIITIDSILGAGRVNQQGTLSNTFIYITAAHATVTIINCECEGFDYSVQVQPLNVGNLAWPILMLNCTWGPKILFSSQCDVTSIANRYLPDTVECDPLVDVMFFSLGDIIIGLDRIPNPDYNFNLNGSTSRLVSRANRYRVDVGRPARFGGKAGMIAPLLTDTALAISQFESGQPH